MEKTIGSTGQYINRLIKNPESIINKTFVKMLEAPDYDITLVYIPRKTQTNPEPSLTPATKSTKKKSNIDLDGLLDDQPTEEGGKRL